MAEEPKIQKPKAVMAAVPWEGPLVDLFRERLGSRLREASSYLGQNFLVLEREAVFPAVELLRDEFGFDFLVDITAVDFPQDAARFELVYILYSYARNERVRLKTRIAERERQPSLVPLFIGANWLEREVFDMFGIEFEGHPDLRRILLPDEWDGFPLRRDYGIIQMDNRWVRENLGIESGQ